VPATELPAVASLLSGTKEPRIVLELDYWVLLPRIAEVSGRFTSATTIVR